MFNAALFDTVAIEKIRQQLIREKQTVAVAESVSSGMLQVALATAEEASSFYQGGLTAYNLDQKVRTLGIDKKEGEACNCVSAKTAAEMALGVIGVFKCDWGVSVTGYATPVPESDFRLYAYFAISHRGKILTEGKLDSEKQEPLQVQLYYANTIMARFANVLEQP